MINILMMRSTKAYLPEIDAYMKYFNKTGQFKVYDSLQLSNEYDENNFDVIWEFKGLGGKGSNKQVLIHEYASLSTGMFPKVKNVMKATLNPKPNLRIFLNENVKNGFKFNDQIDFCYRDMGIDESFLDCQEKNKEFDFVYIGAITKGRGIDQLLKIFQQKKMGKLCLVGHPEDAIYNAFKSNKDIVFTGKVPYLEVPRIASKAIYGINYIPDIYPYNKQTSTKLLEYLALGLKVITTKYQWVEEFEKKHHCTFYKINFDQDGFSRRSLEQHEFKSNFKPQDFLWDKIIERAKIEDKIINIINRR